MVNKTFDVAGLGDLMIDFTYSGKNEDGISLYARNPAGSMANVLAQDAKLGGKSLLLTTLGSDEHSRYLYNVANSLGIDMSCVTYGTLPTRFMFVYHDGEERYFSDYRVTRNESQTRIENIDLDKFKQCRFFDIKSIRFGPSDPIVETTSKLLEIAEKFDVKLVTDMQWRGIELPAEDKAFLLEQAKICTILKVTDEELAYYYDTDDLLDGVGKVFKDSKTELIAVTRGSKGSFLATRNAYAFNNTYDVPVVETTGAGDSFTGSLLYYLSRIEKPISELTEEELTEIADFCNACASHTTMFKGSLLCMASKEDCQNVIQNYRKFKSEPDYRLPDPVIIQK